MPFLSVIIVTWNNENYIEQALSSCIDVKASNYEVIVVHNASDDRTGELIQRSIKGNEHIFRVIENDRNEGLGEARNIGIRHAQGEFVIFLDGDDWFEPDTISEVIIKLQEKNPDVLLYDYQRVWDTGWKARNSLKKLLHEHDASLPEERNLILSVFGVAWNKAYRKAFIAEHQIQFPEGYYEDVTWNYKVMLCALSIYVIPWVAVNYRQRDGSILRSKDARHIILPERYEDLWQFLQKHPHLLELYGKRMLRLVRGHLFAQAVWPRLPNDTRKAYLRRSSEVIDKWRALAGEKRTDITLKVARTELPLLYSLGRGLAVKRKNIRKKLASTKRNIGVNLYRHLFCRLPINSKRVYVEAYWGEKFDGNPISLAEGLKKWDGYEVVVGVKRGVIVPEDFSFKTVTIGSIHYWYIVATSYLLVSDANLDGRVRKRQNTIHLQTKHGTPLKHMGIDNRGKPLHSMNWARFASRCRRWDYVVSSNPYSSTTWRRGFPYEYKVMEVGYPRNDIFFTATPSEVQKIRDSVGVPPGKKVALYAPTFKDYNRDENFCPDLSFKDMQAALGDEYVLLVRAHKFAMATIDDAVTGLNSVIDVSDYISTNEICLISDVLITDYSSIMFDYACLKRPIILFQYDYEAYVSARGVYFDIRQETPGVLVESAGDLLKTLSTKSFCSAENAQKLHDFNAKFCPWDDGKATERVLNSVLPRC